MDTRIRAIDGRYITNLDAKDIPTIRVAGFVGEHFTGAELAGLVEYFCEQGGECRVLLDSMGGYVHDAWHFYDYIRTKGLKVSVDGFGRVASAATVIMAAAGRKRSRLSPNSMYLIHNVSGSDDAEALEVENEKLRAMYVELTGMSRKKVKEMMDKDRAITAQEAYEMGFVGEVMELQKLAASSGLNITDMIEEETKAPEEVTEDTPVNEAAPIAEENDTTPDVVQVEQEVEITAADFKNALMGRKKVVTFNVSAYYGEAVEALAEEVKALKTEKDEAVAEAERLSEAMTNVAAELEAAMKAQGEAEAQVEALTAEVEKLTKTPKAGPVKASAEEAQVPGEDPAPTPRKLTAQEKRAAIKAAEDKITERWQKGQL